MNKNLIKKLKKIHPDLSTIEIDLNHDGDIIDITYVFGSNSISRCSKSGFYGTTRQLMDELEDNILSYYEN